MPGCRAGCRPEGCARRRDCGAARGRGAARRHWQAGSRSESSQMGPTFHSQKAPVEHKTCYPVNSCGVPVTDDDKPKRTKSWREIEKMRDRGGSSRRDSHEREKFESSDGYTKYKTNLDRLFSGGGASLPDHLKEKGDPGGVLEQKDEERKKLYAIEDSKLF